MPTDFSHLNHDSRPASKRLGAFEPKAPLNETPIKAQLQEGSARAQPIRTPQAYRICDGLTEAIIYFMVVFSPWAFGSTQDWAVWVMNIGGYALGILLIIKWSIRRRTGYQPARWDVPAGSKESLSIQRSGRLSTALIRSLATLTVLILSYCLISALNKRAIYDPNQLRYDYYDCIQWLPHSYDGARTWFAFWMYLGLGWTFWALRDWLLGKIRSERHSKIGPTEDAHRLPVRFRRLLWVICVNGALVGLESILQRLDGTNKLLWIREPLWNKTAELQFGPWAYRSNAAQYFNLIWPVCLGFWLLLRTEEKRISQKLSRFGSGPALLLVPFAIVIAACPIISTSRGGAIIVGVSMLIATALFAFAGGRQKRFRLAISLVLLFALGLGVSLGWRSLQERFESPEFLCATGYDIGSNDFTLRSVFLVPSAPPEEDKGLVGLSNSTTRLDNNSGSIEIYLQPDGGLNLRFYNQDLSLLQKRIPDFLRNYSGKTVEIVIVKTSNVQIFINGEAVLTQESPLAVEMSWNAPVASRYLWIGRLYATGNIFPGPIREATFLNYAFSEEEIKDLHTSGKTARDHWKRLSPERISTNWTSRFAPTSAVTESAGGPSGVVAEFDSAHKKQTFFGLDNLSGRAAIYRTAARMAEDFPVYGCGPGTFSSVYSLYRTEAQEEWAAYCHNDWLESRITFGWLGFGLILTSLGVMLADAFIGELDTKQRLFRSMICLSLAGCLIHAWFDFPFQIYSVTLMFLVLSVVLSSFRYYVRGPDPS